VLEDKLELFMRIHNTSHFLQDGAPCHKACYMMQMNMYMYQHMFKNMNLDLDWGYGNGCGCENEHINMNMKRVISSLPKLGNLFASLIQT
jgi:hypothetical protein